MKHKIPTPEREPTSVPTPVLGHETASDATPEQVPKLATKPTPDPKNQHH